MVCHSLSCIGLTATLLSAAIISSQQEVCTHFKACQTVYLPIRRGEVLSAQVSSKPNSVANTHGKHLGALADDWVTAFNVCEGEARSRLACMESLPIDTCTAQSTKSVILRSGWTQSESMHNTSEMHGSHEKQRQGTTCCQLESRSLHWGRPHPLCQPAVGFGLLHRGGHLVKLGIAALQSSLARHQLGNMQPELGLTRLDRQKGLLQGRPLFLTPALGGV